MRLVRVITLFGLVLAVTRPLCAQSPERDRLLNCYYGARTRDVVEARKCLEQLVGQYPQDTLGLIELGFLEVAQQHNEAAIDAFTRAVQAGSKRADVFAQLGYLYLERGDREAALRNFRSATEIDPANEVVRMQTAYILDGLGHKGEAAKLFADIASASSDDARRRQACAAREVLTRFATKQLPEPYFANVYAAPDWYSNINTATLPLRLRGGATLGPGNRIDVFGQFAMITDNRSSGAHPGPVIYFDNVAIFGGGVAARIAGLPGVVLTATAGAAYDIVEQQRDRWRSDLRAGGEYYNTWGLASRCPASISAPFRPVLEVYGSSFYFSRYDDLISAVRIRPGLRVLESARTSLDLNLHLAGFVDTEGLDYNNLFEIGGGLILAPDRRIGLRLGLETVRRQFKGDHHDVVTRARIEYSARF